MILPPCTTSSTRCAHQPAIRDIANIGVYSSSGISRRLYTNPEKKSTFGATVFFEFFTLRNTSGETEPLDIEAVVVRREQLAAAAGPERDEFTLYFTNLEDTSRQRLEHYQDQ